MEELKEVKIEIRIDNRIRIEDKNRGYLGIVFYYRIDKFKMKSIKELKHEKRRHKYTTFILSYPN